MVSNQGTYKPTTSGAVATQAANAPHKSSISARPDFALADLLGQELALPLSDMQAVLLDIETSMNFTRDHFIRLSASVKSARKLAMQSQQIARLAGGRLRQSHENLKLDAMVLAAMQERSREFRKKGIEIFQRIRPVEVIVDAGLLYSLIDAAFDWAAGLGRKLTVTLEMQNWPEHGLLAFKTKSAVSGKTPDAPAHETQSDPSSDSVGWFLINEIALAMGLQVSRTSSGQETSLVIEFSRTVKRLEGLTVVEMESGPESLYGSTRLMAGVRILLITDDARLQAEVREICTGTGMVLECVANASHAVRFCEMESPTLVIIDEFMRDPVFDQLHDDLRNGDPNFPFIEIAAAPSTLEMAGWTSESMSRLSKDALQAHLATILAVELSKVI